jgi:Glycosyltransferase family 87
MPRLLERALLPLSVAAAALALVLAPAPHYGDDPPLGLQTTGIEWTAAALRGHGEPADLAQDYIGARALLDGSNAYPVLGPAYRKVGLEWSLHNRSTHPPTAFLLALPLAPLPWGWALRLWTLAMIGVLVACGLAFGLRLRHAVPLALLGLLWSPAVWSLGHNTPIVLLGIGLAWRWRERPALAGAAIALGGLTKLTPFVLVVPFLLRRKYKAAAAALGTSAAAVGLLALLDPKVFREYATLGRTASASQSHRDDNGSLLLGSAHFFGSYGAAVAAALLVAVAVAAVRRVRHDGIDETAWAQWTWLSVAILPLAWIYSVLTLAPALVPAIRRRGLAGPAAAAAITLTAVCAPFGTVMGFSVLIASFAVGLAVLALPKPAPRPARSDVVAEPRPAEP